MYGIIIVIAQKITVNNNAANNTDGLNALIKLIVDPNWNPKNGRIIAFPPLNTSLIFGSKLPRTNPKINGISKENI